jgi:predicted HicB family RNase H-like nuclease
MNTLEHKGYIGLIELDAEAGLVHGEVINTRDVLTFQGCTVEELKTAFSDTIEDYEDWCRARGKTPEKPYSGKLLLRIKPDLHRALVAAAARSGKSLNSFVSDSLEKVAS